MYHSIILKKKMAAQFELWLSPKKPLSLPNPWDIVVPKGSTETELFGVYEKLIQLLSYLKFEDLDVDNTTINRGTKSQLFEVVIPAPVGLLGNVRVCFDGEQYFGGGLNFIPRIDFSQGCRYFSTWGSLVKSLKEVMEIETDHYQYRTNLVAIPAPTPTPTF